MFALMQVRALLTVVLLRSASAAADGFESTLREEDDAAVMGR